jgi:hypothetical protein
MSSSETIQVLNRVLTILERSFTQYMRYARPYIPPGRESVIETLEEIVKGQDALAERVTQTIHEAGGLADNGKFPIEYTDSHDLSIDFLIAEAIDAQKRDIADLAQCVEALRLAPAAQSLASEALGMAKGNLELLQELEQGSRPAVKPGGAAALANDPPVKKDATGEPHRQEERKMLAGKPDVH